MDAFPLGGGLAQVCTVYEQFGKGVSGWKKACRERPVGKGHGGGGGIRTPGTSRFNGFQDRRNRPLCHPSGRFN